MDNLEILGETNARIKVIGVGGGGGNAVNNMIESQLKGVTFITANTDIQAMNRSKAEFKIQLGEKLTKGLGAGANPEIGRNAAMESLDQIRDYIHGCDMVFVTAGMGGGTGTGSAAVVSNIAKEMGALTIAVTTTPFKGEGRMRMENAEWGLQRLRSTADTVIVIPNDKLIELYPRLGLNQAFKMADEVLTKAIKGITELITKPGLVNLDFNDVRTIMKGAGVAMIGLGESDGHAEDRAKEAIERALSSPLLEVDISGANGVLVNVVGGPDMTISDAEFIAEEVQRRVSPSARIIWGAAVDPTLEKTIRVMVVVAGVKSKQIIGATNEAEKLKKADLDFIR